MQLQTDASVAGYLRINAEMQKLCNNGHSSCQFILDHGLHCRTVNQSFPKFGKLKECFKNALNYAMMHDAIYCEGYALGAVIPVLHAWCIDLNGYVIDPTWRSGQEYIGVPFKTEYVLDFTDKHGVYDSVIEDYRGRWPLILEQITHAKAIHPEIENIRKRLQP